MATLYLTRLCIRNSSMLFRRSFICDNAPITTAFLSGFNNCYDRNLVRSTCGASKVLILQKPQFSLRHYAIKVDIKPDPPEKQSLLQRFKQMYRDYWYVLVPVHLVTSAAWFGGFYYLAKSGVDIAGILESWNVSEKITSSLKDSSMGYLAVSYALYKLATPLRYTVTLGGTTLSINYLKQWGYIKPVPSTNQLKEMYIERKENIMGSIRGKKEQIDTFVESVKENKAEFAIRKDSVKDKGNIPIDEKLQNIKQAKVNLNKSEEPIKISKKQQGR